MVRRRRLLLALGITGLVVSCAAIVVLVRFAITTASSGGRAGAIVLSVILLINVAINLQRVRQNRRNRSQPPCG